MFGHVRFFEPNVVEVFVVCREHRIDLRVLLIAALVRYYILFLSVILLICNSGSFSRVFELERGAIYCVLSSIMPDVGEGVRGDSVEMVGSESLNGSKESEGSGIGSGSGSGSGSVSGSVAGKGRNLTHEEMVCVYCIFLSSSFVYCEIDRESFCLTISLCFQFLLDRFV